MKNSTACLQNVKGQQNTSRLIQTNKTPETTGSHLHLIKNSVLKTPGNGFLIFLFVFKLCAFFILEIL